MSKHMSLEDRFFQKVLKTDSCWLWTGGIATQGYGVFRVDGKSVSAHRHSYKIHKGEIPDGMHVCHSCDVRNCVNPDHLWVGTATDNMQDMIKKGRQCAANKKQERCKHGHSFEIDGHRVYVYKGRSWRICLTCKKAANRSASLACSSSRP